MRTTLAVALGFDAMTSRAARILHDGNTINLGTKKVLLGADVRFRFLDPAGDKWREVREGKSRAAALHGAIPDMPACMKRAHPAAEFVVIRDARKWPQEWFTDDCP